MIPYFLFFLLFVYELNPLNHITKEIHEEPIINALETISKLNPKAYDKFNFSPTTGERVGDSYKEAGLIAQDVLKIPELKHSLKKHHYGVEYSADDFYYSLDYKNIFVYSVAAIKELDAKNATLETKIETLENTIQSLENKINTILSKE